MGYAQRAAIPADPRPEAEESLSVLDDGEALDILEGGPASSDGDPILGIAIGLAAGAFLWMLLALPFLVSALWN
jgi:hypothetical protein